MGNRAHVVFKDRYGISPIVYLHWNGGPESIYAFMAEFKRRGYGHDTDYDAARFTQIVGEFMDQDHFTGTSLGIMSPPKDFTSESLQKYDMYDNGFYVFSSASESELKTKDDDAGEPILLNMWKVERYTYNGKLGPKAVKTEIKQAFKHVYNSGDGTIAETFKKMTGNKRTSAL